MPPIPSEQQSSHLGAAGTQPAVFNPRAHDEITPAPTRGPPNLMDIVETCGFFGGNRPIHAATLYRGIAAGRFPKPVKIGSSNRWVRSECEAALASLLAERDAEAV